MIFSPRRGDGSGVIAEMPAFMAQRWRAGVVVVLLRKECERGESENSYSATYIIDA